MVELSAGEEQCAWLLYAFAGGKGAKVTTLCSECYYYPAESEDSAPRKGDRTDAVNGVLLGHTSTYCAAGCGTRERPEHYEPFWMRTFRFVRLTVESGEEPLTILDFSFRTTGYPLEVRTQVQTSDPTHAPIWDISVRTLRRCIWMERISKSSWSIV